MNENVSNQVGGMVRTLVPMLLTMLVSFGLMDKSTTEALTEPLIVAVMGVAVVSTAATTAWSIYVNQQAQIVKSAAAVAPDDIQVVVGPKAPEAIKRIAEDPAAPNVVKGSV